MLFAGALVVGVVVVSVVAAVVVGAADDDGKAVAAVVVVEEWSEFRAYNISFIDGRVIGSSFKHCATYQLII